MKHLQGGWPKEYDPSEPSDVAKYKKRLERDQTLGFTAAVQNTSKGAIECIRQNNQNDMFEEYFAGEPLADLQTEAISTKTVMLLKDPNQIKRSISKISWHPDHSSDARVAICYSVL